MGRVAPARKVALDVLGDVRRRDARARDVMRSSERMRELDARDRALAMRLVMGCVSTRGHVESLVRSHMRRQSSLEPRVADALCLAAYELLFLSAPASVAVSQGVELVRGVRPRAAGLANAVLRRVAQTDVARREHALALVTAGSCELDDLVLVCGYPAWLLQRVTRDRGCEAARLMCLASTAPAPVYVTPNMAHLAVDEAFEVLEQVGTRPAECEEDGSFVLRNPSALQESLLIQRADVVVADLSAQRVARLVVPHRDASLLEVGQGRGTKSLLMQNVARRHEIALGICGIDSVPFKVRIAQERMALAGVEESVRCMVYDACDLANEQIPERLRGPFDVVFVDAPCSGTGTLRRHPETCWGLSAQDVDELRELQLRMLRAAATRVSSDGVLCYATCSVLRQENEEAVEAFLLTSEGAGFKLVGEPFQSLPQIDGPDGHFCARLRRCD